MMKDPRLPSKNFASKVNDLPEWPTTPRKIVECAGAAIQQTERSQPTGIRSPMTRSNGASEATIECALVPWNANALVPIKCAPWISICGATCLHADHDTSELDRYLFMEPTCKMGRQSNCSFMNVA